MSVPPFSLAIVRIAAALTLGASSLGAQDPEALDSIPTVDQVGAARLPDEIAPVQAPFPMPEFRKPTFPGRRVNLRDEGAEPGTLATPLIQGAIDRLHEVGGGTVVIPEGKWLSGRISLMSNVELHLAEGAELHFSGELEDYRPAVFTRHEGIEVMSLGACIYALDQDNIAITGSGTLFGPAPGPVKEQMMTQSVVEEFVPLDQPVSERVYEGHDGAPIFLPMFISPTRCSNVYIEGVTLEKTAFWNIVPVYCDGVIIRGVTVNSVGIPRGDGIDIESSRNVLIEYSTLNNGDDCFTMKAGRGEDGIRVNRPTENVVVRHCLARQGHGAITVGSETAGVVRNLHVHDCVFDETGTGIRFKTRRPRGGGGENLSYERIRMKLHGKAFRWDMLGSSRYVGELAERLPPREVNELTPHYRDITVRDVIVEKSTRFLHATGIPESPMTGFTLENAVVRSDELIDLADTANLTLRHVTIESPDRTMRILDSRDILFDQVTFKVPEPGVELLIEGPQSDRIRFRDCSPPHPADWQGTEYLKTRND